MQVQNHICLIFILLISVLFVNKVQGQTFEGEILYSKETKSDTSYYAYKIKGDKIRIEELDAEFNLVNYMIVDLGKQSVHAVNPRRKIYVELPSRTRLNFRDTSEFVIYKTENYKNIKGYKCYQWRVRNKKQDTEIAYWVSNEFFDRFNEFVKLINRKEKNSIYFLHIPNTYGFLPLLAVERSILREFRMQHEVLKIEKKNYSAALFEIPEDYKKFKKN